MMKFNEQHDAAAEQQVTGYSPVRQGVRMFEFIPPAPEDLKPLIPGKPYTGSSLGSWTDSHGGQVQGWWHGGE
jgi:hypothetical protein